MKKWNIVIAAAAASVLLGGCAMGGATGDKTTQGVQALESGDYTQAQQLFMEALQNGEQEMLAYRGLPFEMVWRRVSSSSIFLLA